jgi:hypothetical protein
LHFINLTSRKTRRGLVCIWFIFLRVEYYIDYILSALCLRVWGRGRLFSAPSPLTYGLQIEVGLTIYTGGVRRGGVDGNQRAPSAHPFTPSPPPRSHRHQWWPGKPLPATYELLLCLIQRPMKTWAYTLGAPLLINFLEKRKEGSEMGGEGGGWGFGAGGWGGVGVGVLEKDFHEIFVTCFVVTDLRKEKAKSWCYPQGAAPLPFSYKRSEGR